MTVDARICVVDALKSLRGQPVRTDMADRLLAPAGDLLVADLGLESLDTIEWCMEIETRAGVEIDPADFAGLTRVSEIIATVAARLGATKPAAAAKASTPDSGPAPLSFAQERIWQYCHGQSPAPKYRNVFKDRISGPLDVALLRACIDRVVERHDILRTTFPVVDGQVVQFVNAAAPVACEVHQLPGGANPDAETDRIAAALVASLDDLSRQPPVRFALLRISETEHRLLRVWHHLVFDGETCIMFMEELALCYGAMSAGQQPDLPACEQYAKFAVDQRLSFSRGQPEWVHAADWYADSFSTPSTFDGPALKRSMPRPDADPTEGRSADAGIDAEIWHGLIRLRPELGVTSYVIFLAATVARIALDNGNPDVVVGTYITQRRRAEFKHTFGDFSNMVALRFRCDPDMSFKELVLHVRDTVAAGEAHCGPAYEDILDELRLRGLAAPDVQLIFGASATLRRPTFIAADVELGELPRSGKAMPWGFIVTLQETDDLPFCAARFDAVRYDPSQVRLFMGRLREFLGAASRTPDQAVTALGDLRQLASPALARPTHAGQSATPSTVVHEKDRSLARLSPDASEQAPWAQDAATLARQSRSAPSSE